MIDIQLPDLTISGIKYGPSETVWDFRCLLYRGGSNTDARRVTSLISSHALGPLLFDRIRLVSKLHDVLEDWVAVGRSRQGIRREIECLRAFFSWSDLEGRSPTLNCIEDIFVNWTEHLLGRQRDGKIQALTVYHNATAVARLIDRVLDRSVSVLRKTRISKPQRLGPRTIVNEEAFERSRVFGRALLDIADALTVDAIRGKLPIQIPLQNGRVLEHRCGISQPASTNALIEGAPLNTRIALANLRIQTELLIFISQTGMNLTQAFNLRLCRFTYRSHLDGYQVHRVYKGRRQGEVEFEIYREYRIIFERYLDWRHSMFSDNADDFLFPLRTIRSRELPPVFDSLEKKLNQVDIKFVGPQELRRTRINWLMDRLASIDVVAQMAQHTTRTLIRCYQDIDRGQAFAEITLFHKANDLATRSPAPGVCVGSIPSMMSRTPAQAPLPDCISPSGCLFCKHHRDVDSFDHVWSLASYRYLKSIELSLYRPLPKTELPHPASLVISRITAKLNEFRVSAAYRAAWVVEAVARIDEANFHPDWDGFIELAEARI